MNNNLGEQVIVNQGIPHFLPEFQNPIYALAQLAKEQILDKICNGDCFGNLGSLVKTMGGLKSYEIERISYFWLNRGFFELLDLYGEALRANDIVALLNTDALLNENQNLQETTGRC